MHYRYIRRITTLISAKYAAIRSTTIAKELEGRRLIAQIKPAHCIGKTQHSEAENTRHAAGSNFLESSMQNNVIAVLQSPELGGVGPYSDSAKIDHAAIARFPADSPKYATCRSLQTTARQYLCDNTYWG